jgi:hypothetical protein
MRRSFLIGSVILFAGAVFTARMSVAQDAKAKTGLPVFHVDPSWPKIPANMKIGMLMGLAVDSHDNVWLLQRPGTLSAAEKAQAAPPVLEFDSAGNYIQGWGGPGEGYQWSSDRHEHGIFVDYKDNVWVGFAGLPADNSEHQIIKFTKNGKFLMQIGHRGEGKGSNDTANFRGAADMYVDPKTDEIYVADGYGNRRVIVFDANTGAFKRYWGAYGNKPDDSASPEDTKQFVIVHHVVVSNDGLVYVPDQAHGRVQVFTTDGKFVKERVIANNVKPRNGTASIAFSRDPQQRFMYVADLRRWVIDVLDRQTLETLESFGSQGEQPGQFLYPHNIATDSKGNLYVGDMGVLTDGTWKGKAQKFVLEH